MIIYKKTIVFLIFITLIAAILRLTFLGSYPNGITVDEAGQAISAYSILKTGSDEWGDFLPLNPRGFGDYKPPILMYLMVPSIAVFGLNEFAVRLPSALAGILTVFVTFFLVRKLFDKQTLALFAAFFMAISPWHIYYSRLGWESNVGLLFFITGIWLFLKGLNSGRFLGFSALSFGIAGLSYHSFKLLVPLTVISLILIFWKEIKKLKKAWLVSSILVALIFVLLLGYGFIFSGASRRASDQSIMKEENLSLLRKLQTEDGLPQPLNRLVHNKYFFIISEVTDNYLGYFSLPFIFGPHRSDSSILNFPTLGLLYIWQLPLLFIGLWYLLKKRDRSSGVLLSWILLAPIPASLTQDYMHAGRAQALFPALTIVSSLGFYLVIDYSKRLKGRSYLFILVFIVIAASLFIRVNHYLYHTFNNQLGGLKQGYKQVIEFTESVKNDYDRIVFTKAHSEPHSFVAFYAKTDPSEIQKESVGWKKFEEDGLRFLDMTDYNMGKYEFKNINIHAERTRPNTIIVASPQEVPPLFIPKFEVKDASGKVMFLIFDTDELPE